jgi:hypothetical protein
MHDPRAAGEMSRAIDEVGAIKLLTIIESLKEIYARHFVKDENKEKADRAEARSTARMIH